MHLRKACRTAWVYVEFRISQVEVAFFTSDGRRSLYMSGRDSLSSDVSVN